MPSLGSDHNLINCTINCEKPKTIKVSCTVRNVKGIDSTSFTNDLSASLGDLDFDEGSVNEMLGKFDSSILNVLDSHAPSEQRTRSIRPGPPWFDDEISDARRKRRQRERKWLKSKNVIDHDAYVEQNKATTKLIQRAKENYYQEQLETSNSRNMFATMNKLLNNVNKQLPDYGDLNEMCDSFARFFTGKVSKIRKDLDSVTNSVSPDNKPLEYCQNVLPKLSFSSFKQVTDEDVYKLVMSLPVKSCVLDSIPLWLFKDNIEILCEPLTSIINAFSRTGVFPSKLREAVVSPILKKPSLDKEILKHYRPVSNISYASKLMEKIVCGQIKDHLNSNDLQEPFQSAYRELHSTETALRRVRTDILRCIDDGKAVAVVLLDLSAAFDTVDHVLLLNRLKNTFGISGTALAWISSYLKDRSFRVSVGDATSSSQDLRFGIPQGSVVGPLFSVLYTCCIGTIIRKYNIHYHMYADDVQLYLPFNAKSEHDIRFAIDKLSSCINEISEWMTMNKLKLNGEKTEFFLASSQHNLHHLKDICINICGSIISQSVTIRNLGVFFDQTMSMSEHVKHTAASVNYYLRNIYRIRRYITIDSCHKLVRSLVLSRLDYANSMLYGIASKDRKKLQSLQNRAARMVFRSDRRHPSAPLLRDVHWLPLESRIVFKLLLLTYKGINRSNWNLSL